MVDIITIHFDINTSNVRFFNDKFFNNLRNGVYLINTARGTAINNQSLLRNIENRKLAGVALDVNDFEDADREYIKTLAMQVVNPYNIILTPHIAGFTEESLIKTLDILITSLERKEL